MRDVWEGMLRPINKLKYASKSRDDGAENSKTNQIPELKNNMAEEDKIANKRKIYQRGLGLFNKLVVGEAEVTCTCENF